MTHGQEGAANLQNMGFRSRDVRSYGLDEDSYPRGAPIERLLAMVALKSPDAILLVNDAGYVVLAVGAIQRILGHCPTQLVGSPIGRLIPPEARDWHAALQSAFRSDPPPRPMGQGNPIAVIRADGSRLPVSIVLDAFEWEGQRLVLSVIRCMLGEGSTELA